MPSPSGSVPSSVTAFVVLVTGSQIKCRHPLSPRIHSRFFNPATQGDGNDGIRGTVGGPWGATHPALHSLTLLANM